MRIFFMKFLGKILDIMDLAKQIYYRLRRK